MRDKRNPALYLDRVTFVTEPNKTDWSPAPAADLLQQLYAFLTLHATKDFMPKLDSSNAFLHGVQ